MPIKVKKKPKGPTVSSLKKRADQIFSQYIRMSYADSQGNCQCVTCGISRPWKEQQNGHYITRGNNALRYDERNCHPQDAACNVFKSGNYPKYAIFMIKKYGPDILDQLDQASRQLKRWTVSDLQELIARYKEKVKNLENV